MAHSLIDSTAQIKRRSVTIKTNAAMIAITTVPLRSQFFDRSPARARKLYRLFRIGRPVRELFGPTSQYTLKACCNLPG